MNVEWDDFNLWVTGDRPGTRHILTVTDSSAIARPVHNETVKSNPLPLGIRFQFSARSWTSFVVRIIHNLLICVFLPLLDQVVVLNDEASHTCPPAAHEHRTITSNRGGQNRREREILLSVSMFVLIAPCSTMLLKHWKWGHARVPPQCSTHPCIHFNPKSRDRWPRSRIELCDVTVKIHSYTSGICKLPTGSYQIWYEN